MIEYYGKTSRKRPASWFSIDNQTHEKGAN